MCSLNVSSDGSLRFNLAKTGRRKIPQLRRKLGIVFQDFNLLMDRSVEENLRFALQATGWKKGKPAEQRIDDVLTAVGLADRRRSMPHTLSGGERQRIAFARALLNSPTLFIADEVTGNLDPDLSLEVMRIFRRFNEVGVTLLIASHDISLIDRLGCRRIALEDGKLQEEAEPWL